MAFDGFLLLKNIDGESKDDTHMDEIDILTWDWGMTQGGSMGFSGGGGVGKVNIQDLSCTKYVDKATPNLMKFCASGEAIGEGKLVVRKAGGSALEYFVITMTDVIITSVSTGGADGADTLSETVTLNFAHVKVDYTPQEAAGSGGGAVSFGFNIESNKVDA